jgi:hypothetical protein
MVAGIIILAITVGFHRDQETLKREAEGPSWTISACE